eukprot:jgi/Botrbrau1/10546/Bobra.7_1s0023.2
MNVSRMGGLLRIIEVPIFRRSWIYHAWQDALPGTSAAGQVIDWRRGHDLEEKLQLLGRQLSTTLYDRLLKQWRDLESAKSGSIKNFFFRLAQGVIAKEDVDESFLKAIPKEYEAIEIIYPSSCSETYVRRRMRLLLRDQKARLRRRMLTWALASIPMLPLLVLPLPNIPLYYAGYKAWSAGRGLSGCVTLQKSFQQLDSQQLAGLQDSLRSLGTDFPVGSWPALLLSNDPRYRDILENLEGRVQSYYRAKKVEQLAPSFTPSPALEAIVKTEQREEAPITDQEALEVQSQFQVPGLFEHVARGRKRAVGAMFPHLEFTRPQ